MGETTKYDVAVLGLWWSSNYGSIMTYYSLYRLIESYGYRTVIIDRPGIGPDDFLFTTDGRRFQREHFPVTPVFRFQSWANSTTTRTALSWAPTRCGISASVKNIREPSS